MATDRYFFDTEFSDPKEPGFTALAFISIGMVAEDGREFYGVYDQIDEETLGANPWLRDHVLAKLPPQNERLPLTAIQQGILDLIEPAAEIEFWAKNGSYDNYLLCRIFGGMGNLRAVLEVEKGAKNVTFRDSNELRYQFGAAAVPLQPEETKHSAIADARQEKLEINYYDGQRARLQP